jgi:hypothetical protein
VHLSFRFRLCLFKVHQNREIWPPQFPIHKCRIPVVNWGVSRLHWSFKFGGSTERLTSNGFFRPQRHFHLIPEAAHLLLPPIWPQISRPCKAQWSLEMPAKRKINNNSIQCIKDMSWHWLQVGKKKFIEFHTNQISQKKLRAFPFMYAKIARFIPQFIQKLTAANLLHLIWVS